MLSPFKISVGKKKDPNRFASKEYAGLINEVDDSGWPKGQSKGSGWPTPTEDWDQDTEKWGAVDREWGGKEGNWQQVVDKSDGESWPAVGNKSSGDSASSDLGNINSSNSTSGKLDDISVSLPLDSKSRNMFTNSLTTQQSSTTKTPDLSGNSVLSSESWDMICDDTLDLALDAADSKLGVVGSVGAGGVGWGGMGTGGLGGLIGTPLGWDPAAANSKTDTSSNTVKQVWANEANPASTIDSNSWNKTPGKAPKTKTPNDMLHKSPATSTWGGTPADSSSAWVEKSEQLKNMDKSSALSTWDTKTNSSSNSQPQTSFAKKQTVDSSADKVNTKTDTSGWDEAGAKPSWGAKTPDITGTACWDSALGGTTRKSMEVKEKKVNLERSGSGWLDGGSEWDQGNVSKENEENSDGAWDGWTTASSKRNRVSGKIFLLSRSIS